MPRPLPPEPAARGEIPPAAYGEIPPAAYGVIPAPAERAAPAGHVASTGRAATAERLVRALAARGLWLAVAESLTGGLLSGRIVDVPGASAVFQGGVVTYATERKQELLGVDAGLLHRHGPVHPEVAAQMARNTRSTLRADVTLATTGVAGPSPQDGQPVGTIYLACAHPGGVWVRGHLLGGTRRLLRVAAVDLALALGISAVQALPTGPLERSRVP